MIRKLCFIGLTGFTIFMAGCASSRVQSLAKTTQETLELVKREAQRAIELTMQRVRAYEVDPDIGREIVANLKSAEKQIDEQIAKAAELDKQLKNKLTNKLPRPQSWIRRATAKKFCVLPSAPISSFKARLPISNR